MTDFNISIDIIDSLILDGYTEMNKFIKKNKKLFI